MKKKLVSLLLALFVIVGLIAIGVAADEATPATHSDHCVCGGKRDGRGDHKCGEALTGWTAFSLDLCVADSDADRVVVPAGNYYLSSDLTINKQLIIAPDTEVTFCLSGYQLTGSQRVFRVNGILNITDCYLNGNGKIVGNDKNAPVFYGYSGGHINLYGGILTAKAGVTRNYGGVGALATDEGNAAATGGSSMTMYGGTLDASNLTITKIASGNHGSGGAVVLFGSGTNACTFIQYGGTVKGAKSVEGYGTALYGNAGDTIKILGNDQSSGIVTGNCAIAGRSGCNIVVGGGAKIDDLYLLEGQTFTTENLTGKVGLSTPVSNAGVLTSCTETEAALFTSNMPDFRQLSYADGNLSFASVHEDHCVCGGDLTGVAAENHTCSEIAPTWTALTAENMVRDAGIAVASDRETDSVYNMFAQSGCYYLSENIKLDRNLEIRPGQDITICLNGYTLTTGYSQSIFRVTGGTLNICDCTGEGTVKSTYTGVAPVAYLLNGYNTTGADTTLNLYSGNLVAADTSTGSNSGVIQIGNNATVDSAPVMNMYGGTVSGGYAKFGGCIYMVNHSGSELNMYGGKIFGGTASGSTNNSGNANSTGGNIYFTCGSVTVYGGEISGGSASANGGNIYQGGSTALTVKGGSITDGTAAARGGNVFMGNSNAVFSMYDGSVTGGTAKDRGGNIYVDNGKFYMYGGEATGGVLTAAQYGADIAKGAPTTADNSQIHLDGFVRIGQLGTFNAGTGTSYAIYLDDNFSTDQVIQVSANAVDRCVLRGATGEDYQWFVPADEAHQVTLESGKLVMRSADVRYACYCGGTYQTDGSEISHTCNMVSGWIPVNAEFIANSATTVAEQEVTEDVTDEVTGETTTVTTTETVTTVTGWGSVVYSDNASLGGNYYHVPAGYYYLTEDITLDAGLRLTGGTKDNLNNVYIDLNGHKLTFSENAPRGFFVNAYGSLRICDSSYDASVESKSEQFRGCIVTRSTDNWNLGYVSNNGVVRIFGGSYRSEAEKTSGQGLMGCVGDIYLFEGYFKGQDGTNGSVVVIHTSGTAHGGCSVYRATLEGGSNGVNGGVVMLDEDGQSFYLYSGTVIGGTVTGHGGAIYAPAGMVKIIGGTVTGGQAAGEGGSIYAKQLVMTGGTIENATSASYGGNIYLTGDSTVSGGIISGGTSTHKTRSGGNICVANGAELTVSNAEIYGGTANEGGNISIREKATLNIESGKIYNGKAAVHGGNIVAYATLNISGGEIYNGTAVSHGGNISTHGNYGKITVTGGKIYNGILTGQDADGDGILDQAASELYGANIRMYSTVGRPLTLTVTGGEIGGFGEGCVEGVSSVHIQSSGDEITTTVGGTAVIDSIRLGTDRMLTIAEDGFSEGASIGIERFEISGLFAPGAAAECAQYFHATDEGVAVEAEEDGLSLVSYIPYWAFTANNKAIAPAETIADALAMENVGFIRLVEDHTTTEVIEGDVYLDLYGHDLSGLTVNGSLYVIDYKGNSYEEGVLGSLSFTLGQNGTVNGGKAIYSDADRAHFSVANSYVMLANEDSSYSFHRVSVSITHVSLKADADALGFKATVTGDAQVLAAITGFGFNMGVEGGNMKSYKLEGNPADGVFTLRLKNIMAAGGGEMTIIGQPVIYFGEDAMTGGTTNTSMKQTIEAVEAAVEKSAEAYTEAQMTTVQALITQYESSMEGWNIDAIKAWTAPSTEETPAA